MRVELIGMTRLVEVPSPARGTRMDADLDPADWANGSEALAEIAGRTCYESYDKPNPATTAPHDYLGNILSQGHFSVLEHGSVSFFVGDVSRSLLAELTRHRHLSFSVRSQRFVSERYRPVVPPAIRDDPEALAVFHSAYAEAHDFYIGLRDLLASRGLPRKQANEAARSVLPSCQATSFVVTGNHRAWREVVAKRKSPHADAEINELACALHGLLVESFPAIYQDMP